MNENKGKLDNVLEVTYLKEERKEKPEYTLKTGELGGKVVSAYKKIEETVIGGYKKIEGKFVDTFMAEGDEGELEMKTGEIGDKVVSAYQKIEDAVVDSYKKIEDKFVETFLEKK